MEHLKCPRIENSMYDILDAAMKSIQEKLWEQMKDPNELSNEVMEAKLREELAEIYTTGADTNVFPHEEIADYLGENPSDIDAYFAEEFSIQHWHKERED